LCIDLGWTRDEVLDQVDLPFLRALRAEWRAAPPARHALAASIGYKPPRKMSAVEAGATGKVSVAALNAAFPNGRL
jgi:hypothetical protein